MPLFNVAVISFYARKGIMCKKLFFKNRINYDIKRNRTKSPQTASTLTMCNMCMHFEKYVSLIHKVVHTIQIPILNYTQRKLLYYTCT